MFDKDDSYWRVPELTIASTSIPRLFLGDHGFLQLYGSALATDEIVDRMRFAITKSSIGLAAGDHRCLQAARDSLRLTRRNNALLFHTDLRLSGTTQKVEFERAMHHLYRWLEQTAPHKLEEDPIVGHFLKRYANHEGYDAQFIRAMEVDLDEWHNDVELIRQFRPRLVTVGGDILDFALVAGRADIVVRGLQLARQACNEEGVPLFVTLYVAAEAIRNKLLPPTLFDGVMVPINPMGHGMLPSRDELLSYLSLLDKPILAMHVLASGAISAREGLDYACSVGNASMAVVGASQPSHIEELLAVGQQVLGHNRGGG